MARRFIVGVGMTRFGKLEAQSVKDLTREAVGAALADANLDAAALEAAFFSNVMQGHMEGQHCIRGQIALREMGVEGIPVVNVENACASAGTALLQATWMLDAGAADVVLAIGVEKLFSEDKALMFSSFDSGWDVSTADENEARLVALGEGVEAPEGTTSTAPYSRFMDVYAAFGRRHMLEFGTTQEQIAAVAAKNHQHSVHNPLSQYRKPFTLEEVINAAPITWPLTLPMCAPISDGAAAAIVCSEKALRRIGRARAVELRSCVLRSGTERTPERYQDHISHLAAVEAYEKAAIDPGDVDAAEVHDATAVGEIMQVENLELVPFGEGGPAALRGDTKLGGRIPVNPSGGLESKGHPLGATGLGQIHELVTQLRGEAGPRQVEGARIAVAENGGGLVGIEEAACCVTVLGREGGRS